MMEREEEVNTVGVALGPVCGKGSEMDRIVHMDRNSDSIVCSGHYIWGGIGRAQHTAWNTDCTTSAGVMAKSLNRYH